MRKDEHLCFRLMCMLRALMPRHIHRREICSNPPFPQRCLAIPKCKWTWVHKSHAFLYCINACWRLGAKRHTTPCLWTRKTDSITNRPRWLLSPSRWKMDYWCLARLVSRVSSRHSMMPHGMNPRPPHLPAISETVTGLGAHPSPPTAILVPAHGTNKHHLSQTMK